MSKKVTKVDGSIDEKNELKCTVGDKFLGLLSTKIDKALMLKDEETQLKCSPEYTAGANIDLICGAGDEKRFRTRLSEKTVVEKIQEEKMTIAKSTVVNAAAEEGTVQQEIHMGTSQHGVDMNAQPEVLDHLRERMSRTDELPHHSVHAREKQEVLEQLS